MRTILGNSRRVSGQHVSPQEFRLYWPHAARNAQRNLPQIESILSVRSGLKGNGKLLGLVLQTASSCFAMTVNGQRCERSRTVGQAVDQLRLWSQL